MLSDYELERNERVESNKRLMESLGLNSDVAALKRAAGKPAIVFRAPFASLATLGRTPRLHRVCLTWSYAASPAAGKI